MSNGGNSVVLEAAPVVVTVVIFVSLALEVIVPPEPDGAPVTVPDGPECAPVDVVSVTTGGVRLGVASAHGSASRHSRRQRAA